MAINNATTEQTTSRDSGKKNRFLKTLLVSVGVSLACVLGYAQLSIANTGADLNPASSKPATESSLETLEQTKEISEVSKKLQKLNAELESLYQKGIFNQEKYTAFISSILSAGPITLPFDNDLNSTKATELLELAQELQRKIQKLNAVTTLQDVVNKPEYRELIPSWAKAESEVLNRKPRLKNIYEISGKTIVELVHYPSNSRYLVQLNETSDLKTISSVDSIQKFPNLILPENDVYSTTFDSQTETLFVISIDEGKYKVQNLTIENGKLKLLDVNWAPQTDQFSVTGLYKFTNTPKGATSIIEIFNSKNELVSKFTLPQNQFVFSIRYIGNQDPILFATDSSKQKNSIIHIYDVNGKITSTFNFGEFLLQNQIDFPTTQDNISTFSAKNNYLTIINYPGKFFIIPIENSTFNLNNVKTVNLEEGQKAESIKLIVFEGEEYFVVKVNDSSNQNKILLVNSSGEPVTSGQVYGQIKSLGFHTFSTKFLRILGATQTIGDPATEPDMLIIQETNPAQGLSLNVMNLTKTEQVSYDVRVGNIKVGKSLTYGLGKTEEKYGNNTYQIPFEYLGVSPETVETFYLSAYGDPSGTDYGTNSGFSGTLNTALSAGKAAVINPLLPGEFGSTYPKETKAKAVQIFIALIQKYKSKEIVLDGSSNGGTFMAYVLQELVLNQDFETLKGIKQITIDVPVLGEPNTELSQFRVKRAKEHAQKGNSGYKSPLTSLESWVKFINKENFPLFPKVELVIRTKDDRVDNLPTIRYYFELLDLLIKQGVSLQDAQNKITFTVQEGDHESPRGEDADRAFFTSRIKTSKFIDPYEYLTK